MPYLTHDELYSVIRDYQVEVITDGNDDLVDQAIDAAITEISDSLTANQKKIWEDGRLIYDVPAIFAQAGADRNALVLSYTKTIAVWHLIGLCNAGAEYQKIQDRYDRAMQYFMDLADGTKNSATLPQITVDPPEDIQPYQSSSRPKFHHE
ncbi:MAG: phage protein Gp36 family protein [Mucilaginibacter sp.]